MRDMSEEITLTNSGDFQSTGKSGIYEGPVVIIKMDSYHTYSFFLITFDAIIT